jgi:hypothetical protein
MLFAELHMEPSVLRKALPSLGIEHLLKLPLFGVPIIACLISLISLRFPVQNVFFTSALTNYPDPDPIWMKFGIFTLFSLLQA